MPRSGRGGVTSDKLEGDGATPAGILPMRRVLYRADRVRAPGYALPMEPIAPNDGWCDDPAEARLQSADPPATRRRATRNSWRQDGLYDVIAVLGWNDAPVQRGRGSAIFLHVARPDYAPTEGCVALALSDLRQVLAVGVTRALRPERLNFARSMPR